MSGNSYYSRKLHSLLGVIPLGLFFIEHALTNYSAFEGGKEKFLDSVHGLHDLPLIFFLEMFIIWLPILFHGVYGLYLAFTSNLNVGRFNYGRNWAFALQRITGVITFIFVIWHVWQTRIQVALGNTTYDELGEHMHSIVTQPGYFTLYFIAVLAAVFHFSNGLWAFLVSWGITIGPRAQRVSSRICMGIFVIVSVLFLLSLFAFRGDEFASASAAIGTLQLG
ncbi:succinate dehydrogenase cytochrome b558 subunit [Cohnella thermotolerans]|jgi:succinate dehydrogenase / fumarate reductase cytochrome b subunit|uniref:succinate dehydrogenase cytochrome b558 subunit n=1 Tax=Cohnella thermotolerans TaxID=329858 RepID=UPI000418EDC4|nr:succinate dehydrogenase cytochrome b558 subunit [Cohnella thermotolerans]